MDFDAPTPTRLPAVLEFDDDGLPPREQDKDKVEKYQYEALPNSHCVRLFELLPGIGSSSLCGQISIANLDDDELPYYRALSYTWVESEYDNLIIAGEKVVNFPGPRKRYFIQHPIWINGCRLLISTNLRDALRRFRRPDISVRFWIDAICINQADLDERANQVVLMPRIYHLAKIVCFWLGEADEASQIALTWMEKCQQVFSQPDAESPQSSSNLQIEIELTEAKSLVSFLQRPVFQRVWIIQEITTAREVIAYCGAWSISFRIIQQIISILSRNLIDELLHKQFSFGKNSLHCVNVLIQIQKEWYFNRKNVRQRLALLTRNFAATDPKDKIFALLGLFNDFAHRTSCHLGLCDESHRPIGQVEEIAGLKIIRDRDHKSGLAQIADILNKSTRELLIHEAKIRQMMEMKRAAEIFCQSSNEQMQDARYCLMKHLCSFTGGRAESQISDSSKESSGRSICEAADDAEHEVTGDLADEAADEAADDTAEGTDADLIVQKINDFLGLKSEDSNVRLVQNFICDVVESTYHDHEVVTNFSSDPAMREHYADASNLALKKIQYFLRLIAPNLAAETSGSPNVVYDAQVVYEDGMFCGFHFPHNSPFTYKPGKLSTLYSSGLLLVACSSCDNDLLESAFNALIRSDFPPHTHCTFRESAWRLLKAVFASMSAVHLEGGVITMEMNRDREILSDPPVPEEFVDSKWLTMPLSWYFEEIEKELAIPEPLSADPLQQWSWSSSISRMPDYRLSVTEIYREFTLRCLHEDPDLFILSAVEDHSVRHITHLPSWVPDFSVSLTRSLLVFPNLDEAIPYAASGGSKPLVTWSEATPDILQLRGYKVDIIQGVLATDSTTQPEEVIQQSLVFTRDFPSKYCTGELSSEALWRTLSANITGAPYFENPAPAFFSQFFAPYYDQLDMAENQNLEHEQVWDGTHEIHDGVAHLRLGSNEPHDRARMEDQDEESKHEFLSDPHEHLSTGEDPSDTDSAIETEEHDEREDKYRPDHLLNAIYRATKERKFFVTENQRYGIGPQSIRENDLVYILEGGRIPYILRPYGESSANKTFTFVGECYCHGLCQGESLVEPGFSWEEILLE